MERDGNIWTGVDCVDSLETARVSKSFAKEVPEPWPLGVIGESEEIMASLIPAFHGLKISDCRESKDNEAYLAQEIKIHSEHSLTIF